MGKSPHFITQYLIIIYIYSQILLIFFLESFLEELKNHMWFLIYSDTFDIIKKLRKKLGFFKFNNLKYT
jgi:hypothetical protein